MILQIIKYSLVLGTISTFLYAEPVLINGRSGHFAVKTWKDFRDQHLIKQQLDYSCGAASLTTILKFYYNDFLTESDVLASIKRYQIALETNNFEALLSLSFKDLQDAAKNLGYKTVGLAISIKHLQQLKIPAILYVKYKREDHFTVLKSINDKEVILADPSLGNRRLPIDRFIKIWSTRENKDLVGKILLVFPLKETKSSQSFFNQAHSSNLVYETIYTQKTR